MSKEALRNQLQRVRAELNHLSNMIELTPEPDPEPDPEPSPDHQNSIFGWNLGWQNYWSTCRLIDDIVYPQTYTIKDDGEPYEFTKSGVMVSGTSTFQMNADPAVLKPGRYIYKNNLGGGTCTPSWFSVSEDETHKVTFRFRGNQTTGCYVHEDSGVLIQFTDTAKERYRNAGVCRIMDWQHTNESGLQAGGLCIKQNDRIKHVISPALISRIAMELDVDIWYCVHDETSGETFRSHMEQIADTWPGHRTLYIEHSNEVWNGRMPQHRRLKQYMPAGWSWGDFFRKHAAITNSYARVAKEIIGADRVQGVVGAQLASLGTVNPLRQMPAVDLDCIHAIAVAPYFGSAHRYSGPDDLGAYLEYCRRDEEDRVRDSVIQHQLIADSLGVHLYAYEGGLHAKGGLNVFEEAAASEDMAHIYRDHLEFWASEIGQPYALYCDVRDDCFGHFQTERSKPQPRGNTVLTAMENNPL